MITAQQLIQKLERIVAEYGPGTLVEARNPAGDFDYLQDDYESYYGVNRNSVNAIYNGERTVVRLEP